MKRNSTFPLAHRELPVGGRQRKGRMELASERLPQIFSALEKVDADGTPAVIRAGYKGIMLRIP